MGYRTPEIATCTECGMPRVVTVSMTVGFDRLVCHSCMSCGATSWERAGRTVSWDEVCAAARALWAVPSPRRRGDLARTAA